MKRSFEALKQKLAQKNIRLSHQRLKVLDHLARHSCPLAAAQIFAGLHKGIATLFTTPVYNTLRTLAEAGLVRVTTIDGSKPGYRSSPATTATLRATAAGPSMTFGSTPRPCTPQPRAL